MGGIPADLLIYIIIAGALVVWLRNTLGTRSGDERQRPNPFENQPPASNQTVEPIPANSEEGAIPLSDLSDNALKNIAFESEDAKDGFMEIARADRMFHPQDFIKNAKEAFVIVVEAFADGDKEMLSELLAPQVYEGFEAAIDERSRTGESVDTEIHAVQAADVNEAGIRDGFAFVTLRIRAEETAVIRDRDGKIISGDPDRITEMADLWTFGRKLKSKDPTWLIYETQDGEPEDHKTPLPDAS